MPFRQWMETGTSLAQLAGMVVGALLTLLMVLFVVGAVVLVVGGLISGG